MTCSTPPTTDWPFRDTLPEPLYELVRLLARDAARADVATRCTERSGEVRDA